MTRRDGRVTNLLPENLVAEVAKLRRENHKLRGTDELCKLRRLFHIGTRSETLRNDPIHR